MIGFIITVVLVYIVYFIYVSINYDKNGKPRNLLSKNKDKEKKLPSEVEYFISKYNIDLNKINMKYFLLMIGLILALIIGVVATIMDFINVLWIKVTVGIILTVALALLSFKILGDYCNKKGLTKEDKKGSKK